MVSMNTQTVVYGAIAIAIIGALGSFVTGGGIAGIIAAIICALGAASAFLFYKYGYVLWPLITTGAKVVQVTDTGYEIPPTQDVILKNVNGIYYATMFLAVKIYESASEKSPEENTVLSEYFERAIGSVKFVTKFAMLVYVKDLTLYRNQLETKRAEAQLRLSRERDKPEPDVLKLDRYEREVGMWENQINRLVSGVKPMGALSYVMTTATGVTKEAATSTVKAQGNELRATISNALNVEVVALTGEEMMRCFDWEHTIPPTQGELEQAVA